MGVDPAPPSTPQSRHMRKAFHEQTRIVEQAAERLRAGYDVEQLHDLRVAIRRIRSLLQRHGKHRARRWRRIWGSFARVTSRARDWDVFLETAAALLPPEQEADLRAACGERLQTAHESVRAMLRSALWNQHLADWLAYASGRRGPRARAAGRIAHAPAPGRSLRPALARASQALSAALALPDDSGWHPFRIAVKELRYQADLLPTSAGGEPDPQTVIATCKDLQAELGGWHDCVVQLELLDELRPATETHAILLRTLRDRIEALRQERLAGIHAALERQSLVRDRNGATS